MTRKRLATTGPRGNLVRLFLETKAGVRHYIVQWGPKREQATYDGSKDGKAEAEAFFKTLGDELRRVVRPATPMTNREIRDAFFASELHLRPRTRKLYWDDWRTWEQHAGANNAAEETTVVQCADFRKVLDSKNLATATVKATITNIRTIFNWAERMELIQKNRWHLFILKIPKDKRTKPRAEYSAAEFARIWAALDPKSHGQWRPWVAIGLLGIYGNRQNEILNLQWSWLLGDVVTVPLEYVKTGEEATLRLFPLTRGILDVAREWAAKTGYQGDYVLFPGRRHNKEPHYSIQSLTDALHAAEERAGVEYIRWRAGHGFRRGLVGDIAVTTGDIQFALQVIGDRDMSMAPRYRVRRNERIDKEVQDRADRIIGQPATNLQPTPTGKENGPRKGPLTEDSDT